MWRLSSNEGGHLPHLQHLRLSPWLAPTDLLQSLLPLRPLSELADLSLHTWHISICCEPGQSAEQAAALLEVMHLLAPRLPLQRHIALDCMSQSHDGQLSLKQVSNSLRPWGRQLTRVCLWDSPTLLRIVEQRTAPCVTPSSLHAPVPCRVCILYICVGIGVVYSHSFPYIICCCAKSCKIKGRSYASIYSARVPHQPRV